MKRIHRALRPRGRDSDPPRDVVCCVIDYRLKEDILRKARTKAPLKYKDADVRLCQDLSNITLQRRKELHPLLEVLRNKGIQYIWKYPFGLSASTQGRSALLRVPEDLRHFCDMLEIPYTEVPKWYMEFCPQAARRSPSGSEPLEIQEHRIRRQRSPSEDRSHNFTPGSNHGSSPLKAPHTRRAHRDR